RAVDPATGEELDERFPVSPREELGALAAAGKRAAAVMREVPAERIAEFLERCAAEIEADADALAARAARETGLPLRPRLREVEIGRTLDQLRQAAACVRTGAWALPVVDRERDLASAYTALGGPVFVIGPSNFPFAYNALGGGDFASALAAGNPVIAKANPGHPGTTGMLAQCIARAIEQCPTLPPAVVQMFYHCAPEDGLWLAAHRDVAAIGFTGSRATGLKIKEVADRAGKPVYLEMSSVNPVFVLPGALARKARKVTEDFVASCLLAAGQMCTNPGLVVVPAGEAGEMLLAAVSARFLAAPPGVLLGPSSPEHLETSIEILCRAGASVVVGGKR